MKTKECVIVKNTEVAKNIYKLEFKSTTHYQPGQFLNIGIDGFLLRRPISIAGEDGEIKTIYYRLVGSGTKQLSKLKSGEKLSILEPLGTGFTIKKHNQVVVVGGGIGIAPLYYLVKELVKIIEPNNIRVILGFRSQEEIYLMQEFSQLGVNLDICTDDGTFGFKGNVIEFITEQNINPEAYLYTCGPLVMLKELKKIFKNGEVSTEARMACGFGVCRACMIKDGNKMLRVCKEGPVFTLKDVNLDGLTC